MAGQREQAANLKAKALQEGTEEQRKVKLAVGRSWLSARKCLRLNLGTLLLRDSASRVELEWLL